LACPHYDGERQLGSDAFDTHGGGAPRYEPPIGERDALQGRTGRIEVHARHPFDDRPASGIGGRHVQARQARLQRHYLERTADATRRRAHREARCGAERREPRFGSAVLPRLDHARVEKGILRLSEESETNRVLSRWCDLHDELRGLTRKEHQLAGRLKLHGARQGIGKNRRWHSRRGRSQGFAVCPGPTTTQHRPHESGQERNNFASGACQKISLTVILVLRRAGNKLAAFISASRAHHGKPGSRAVP
jgi:hypothetical protein